MRSPALAIAWEFWGRSRLGLTASAVVLLALCVLARVLPAGRPGSEDETIELLATLVTPFLFIYLLAVFIYSDVRDGSRNAGFPPRMFTLPLRTSVLVALPMLYGIVAVAVLWLAVAWLIWLSKGMTPVWWPAAMLAAGLACFQAVSWTLVSSPLLRLIVAVLILPALGLILAVVVLIPGVAAFLEARKAHVGGNDLLSVLLFAAFIPIAYAVAVVGVARDRRGEKLGWAWLRENLVRIAELLPRRPAATVVAATPRPRPPYASGASAQFWLEWWRKGWILPLFPACFLLYFLAVVTPLIKFDLEDLSRTLLALFALPVVLAFFVGYGLGKTSFWAHDLGLTTFTASRPLSSEALAAAKLRMALLSSVATWALILLGAPLLVAVLGEREEITRAFDQLMQAFPTWKVGAVSGLGLVGLFTLTWTQLIAGLTGSLSGRPWVVNVFLLLYLGVVATVVVVFGAWVYDHPAHLGTFVIALSWSAGLAVVLKGFATGWVLHRTHRRGLRLSQIFSLTVGLWLLGVASLVTLVVWLVPADGLSLPLENRSTANIPRHLLALVSILALPLARVLAAPLALAWNRHR